MTPAKHMEKNAIKAILGKEKRNILNILKWKMLPNATKRKNLRNKIYFWPFFVWLVFFLRFGLRT